MPNFRVDPPPERFYGPHNLGGACEGCGNAIPAALAGQTRHATCDLDFPALNLSLKRALARRKVSQP